MSLLPILWNIAEDFDRMDPCFGVSFNPYELRLAHRLPQLLRMPAGYHRHWKLDEGEREKAAASKTAVTAGKDGFQVCLDVQQFAPNEITVKAVENSIVVEGKHEEREDQHGYITRHFVRRYMLPKEYDIEQVVSTLSSDGVLTVRAPPVANALEQKERVIQIQQTGPAHLSVKDNTKDEAKDDKEAKQNKK
ncbi:heat shock protein 23 [Lutzomyia longipalpis]|uniref:Putative 23kda heat shock protein schsp23 n=1 Tax=Lutzomyia longipalpis TaxID=7200 RepID=A0A1B0CP16_LUTLO|nr:heat shock protein 23 [Lutzomyia longipalpis]